MELAQPTDSPNDDVNFERLRSRIGKLFELTKYYAVYTRDFSEPGLLTSLLQYIQTQLRSDDPNDVELAKLVGRYTLRNNILSQAEYDSLREPLMSACQSLVERKIRSSNG